MEMVTQESEDQNLITENTKTRDFTISCKIIPRSEHCISRQNISDHALKVMYRLKKHGFEAYLVGGSVRDLLLNKQPKDFDVATNATPEEIRSMFKNSRIIGRRFKIAHVCFHREIIEVTTFRAGMENRADPKPQSHTEHGMLLHDNVYGTIEEDVWRRDFTINAIYYNINDFSLIDFTNALEDLAQKAIRIIGDPEPRFREDPVRILRAIRFAAKLNFAIEPLTAAPIPECRHLLHHIPPARLYDEFLKLFLTGAAQAVYELLKHYELFKILFPLTQLASENLKNFSTEKFLNEVFYNTDQRIANNLSTNASFMLAAILYPALLDQKNNLEQHNFPENIAHYQAMQLVLKKQNEIFIVAKAILQDVRNIWQLIQNMQAPKIRNLLKIVTHNKYRAAYDLIVILSKLDRVSPKLVKWWHEFYQADPQDRKILSQNLTGLLKSLKIKNKK